MSQTNNIIFFYLFLYCISLYSQEDTIYKNKIITSNNKNIDTTIMIGPGLSSLHEPLYIVDGLKIDNEKFAEIQLCRNKVKKIRIDKEYVLTTSDKVYFGAIRIYTKILFIFNDSLLEHKREKIKVLSKVKQEEIKSIKKIDADKAIEKYGKAGKHGAIIIKTR